MAILEPMRRGAEEFVDALGEKWDWLRERGASALTRFRTREDDPARPPLRRGEAWGLLASDVAETDDEVVVRLEAPGLEEKDFSVTTVGDELIVRGEKRMERDAQEADWHGLEAAYGGFERRIPLPCRVAADRARAGHRNGVLMLRMPKTPDHQPRQISVQAS